MGPGTLHRVSTSASLLVGLVLGLALGAALAVLLVRSGYAARTAGLVSERDLLARRVGDLERDATIAARDAASLAPLRESVERVARQVGVLERDRVEQFGELGERLGMVHQATEALRAQTASLTGSLQSSSVRGAWGETTLRRVVEHAGMLAHVDFEEQQRGTNAAGSAVRPDLVVRLPGEGRVVVDAKVPLAAFLRAQEACADERRRAALLVDHARSLRRHVETLAAKQYWSALDSAPEMVVAFVPADAILATALVADPALYDDAQRRGVILASPATLLALLRTVALTWRQDSLTSDARELLALGEQLYSRLSTLGRHTAAMGSALQRSVESYNAFVGALETRVMVTARRMSQLDPTRSPLEAAPPVHAAPRPLSAAELLDALEPEVARDELAYDDPPQPPPGRRRDPA